MTIFRLFCRHYAIGPFIEYERKLFSPYWEFSTDVKRQPSSKNPQITFCDLDFSPTLKSIFFDFSY